MSGETGRDGADGGERAVAELKPGTFKDCGVAPRSSTGMVEVSELFAIADMIDPVYRQAVALFC